MRLSVEPVDGCVRGPRRRDDGLRCVVSGDSSFPSLCYIPGGTVFGREAPSGEVGGGDERRGGDGGEQKKQGR